MQDLPKTPQTFVIANRDELFIRWEAEAARFKNYYHHLAPELRDAPVKASPCGHVHHQHVPCMIVWIEAAVRFFEPRTRGERVPYREDGLDMLDYTNESIAALDGLDWETLWARLETADAHLRGIIDELSDAEIFTNEDRVWEHLVWSAFGHYGEHSDEWEWEQAGKDGFSPDHIFTSPLLGST